MSIQAASSEMLQASSYPTPSGSISFEVPTVDSSGREYQTVPVTRLNSGSNGSYFQPIGWSRHKYYSEIISGIFSFQFNGEQGTDGVDSVNVYSYVNTYRNHSAALNDVIRQSNHLVKKNYLELVDQGDDSPSYRLTNLGYTVASRPYVYMPAHYIVMMILSQEYEIISRNVADEILNIATERDSTFADDLKNRRRNIVNALRELSRLGVIDIEEVGDVYKKTVRAVWKGDVKALIPSNRDTRQNPEGNTLETIAIAQFTGHLATARQEGYELGFRNASNEYQQTIDHLNAEIEDLQDQLTNPNGTGLVLSDEQINEIEQKVQMISAQRLLPSDLANYLLDTLNLDFRV